MSNLSTELTNIKGEITSTISKYNWSLLPDSQLIAAESQLTKSSYISEIAAKNTNDVQRAVVKSCILGIDLTEGKNQGWLLPRKNQNGKTTIALQVGYKGVEAIYQRMGVIDNVSIRVVYENDTFEWSGDDQEKPKHNADWFGDRGKPAGCFCITYFPSGRFSVMLESVKNIYEKHRDISDSWKSEKGKKYSPWTNHEESMIMKTMIYIASKQWPAHNKNEKIANDIEATLKEVDYSDYQESFVKYTQAQKNMFTEFYENNNCLEMFLLTKNLELEVKVDLLGMIPNTMPRGNKLKTHDKIGKMLDMGQEIYAEIISAIDQDDILRLLENTGEPMPKNTKVLLWNVLDVESQKKLTEMMK